VCFRPRGRCCNGGGDGAAYRRADGLAVIASGAVEQDGRRWLHVSCSRATQLPSWQDLRDVKELFCGPERAAKHVNIHPHCLHLWCCLEGDVLPDFTQGGNTI